MLRRLHVTRGMVVSFDHESNLSGIFARNYCLTHDVGQFGVVPAGHTSYTFTHLLHGFAILVICVSLLCYLCV